MVTKGLKRIKHTKQIYKVSSSRIKQVTVLKYFLRLKLEIQFLIFLSIMSQCCVDIFEDSVFIYLQVLYILGQYIWLIINMVRVKILQKEQIEVFAWLAPKHFDWLSQCNKFA